MPHNDKFYDMKDEKNIKNSKLSLEEVITLYFEALDRGDGTHFQYVSIEKLMSHLYTIDYKKLFSKDWYEWMTDGDNNIESVKLLSIEKSKNPSDENKMNFNIKIDSKFKKEITTNNGIDILEM